MADVYGWRAKIYSIKKKRSSQLVRVMVVSEELYHARYEPRKLRDNYSRPGWLGHVAKEGDELVLVAPPVLPEGGAEGWLLCSAPSQQLLLELDGAEGQWIPVYREDAPVRTDDRGIWRRRGEPRIPC